jgi:hypothetical protein|tara:strand:+ start:73 stop:489 length:417 start_codon:yes stop_codon:yes gene_type:complete
MKISKVNKIDDHFREINTEAVFVALKEKKYSGFTRSQINQLLEKYDNNKVLRILKKRHKKINYLLIYSISLILALLIFSGTIFYFYYLTGDLIFLKYIKIEYYNNLQLIDYCILSLVSISILSFILCLYELYVKLRYS